MQRKLDQQGMALVLIIIAVVVIVGGALLIMGGSFHFNVNQTAQKNSRISQAPTSIPNTGKNTVLENKSFKSDGISLKYPGDWTQKNESGYIAVFYTPTSKKDAYHENVNIKTVDISSKPTLTLNNIADLWLSQTQKAYSKGDFTLMKRNTTKVSGLSAESFVYVVNDNGRRSQGKTVIVLKNTTAYILSYTALEKTYNEFESGFEAILSSVSFN